MLLRELIDSGVLPKRNYIINIIEPRKGNEETEYNGTDDISEDLLGNSVTRIRSSMWRNVINVTIE